MPSQPSNKAYSDDEYAAILAQERHMYAWTLETFGGYARADADARALWCYPSDPVEQNGHGLLFNDRAWHWAMIELHGSNFWTSKPKLLHAPAAYFEEESRFCAAHRPEERPAR